MLDLTKPVQTREGVPVRILCTDSNIIFNGEPQPIVAIAGTVLSSWSMNGKFYPNNDEPHELDLVNVLPKKRYITVFIDLCVNSNREPYAVAEVNKPPSRAFGNTVASTTIEMEYEEQP